MPNRGRAQASIKAWAAWGLGLAGQVDTIRLLVEGQHQVFSYPIHSQTSALECAFTADGSRERGNAPRNPR